MGFVIVCIVIMLLWAALFLMEACKELKKEMPKWEWVFFCIFWALLTLFGVMAILVIR